VSSKYKRKGKQKFIMLPAWLMKSAAWHSLTAVERAAYLEVKLLYDGLNNGRIGLGCRDLADSLRMGHSTAAQALKGLEAKGFIVKTKASAFHVKSRVVSEWRLTEYRCDLTGDLPSKDFMRWVPETKRQSASPDTQSTPADRKGINTGQKQAHSPIHRTVNANFSDSQSAPPDTYRYTTGGKTNAV
jgi:hypothetical protein